MLTPYRRHKNGCKIAHLGMAATNCPCPVWAYGTDANGRSVRRSLGTKDWTHAHKKMVQLEAGTVIDKAPCAVTIESAIEAYLNDCEARHIESNTLAAYRNSLKFFRLWCAERKLALANLSVEVFSDYRRNARELSANSQGKEIIILRMWLKFCLEREWVRSNYAKSVKLPKQTRVPTLPYSREEVSALIAACAKMPDPVRMKALTLTLLYSGLRIKDTVTLERTRIQADGRLLLRMEKTKQPVYVRLPDDCMAALNALPLTGAHFFWDRAHHKAISESNMTRQTIIQLGLIAGVVNCHPHRFRDTFAVELLLNGADIRTVQKLLGHTSLQTTEKHYAPWVTAMQAKLDTETAKLRFS